MNIIQVITSIYLLWFERVILNQVNFSDSCDFNNVNIFAVPHFNLKLDEEYPEYLSNSFKKLILDLTQDKKILTTEVIPRDPVYTAFDIGFSNTSQSKSIFSDTVLYITRDKNNKINKNTIKQRVVDAILKFFTPTHNELGQKIDILSLSTDILSIEGVKSIKTTNKKENVSHYGVSFVTWNPMFEGVDEQIVTQTITLPFFKFPYLYRPNSIINRIEVVDE